MYRIPVIFLWALANIAWPQTRQGGLEGPGLYVIISTESHLALELDRLDHRTMIQSPAAERVSQRWDIQRAGPELIYIRNAEEGKALDGPGGISIAHCEQYNGGISQQWRTEPTADGGMLILSTDGRALEINEGAFSGSRLRIAAKTGGPNQRFSFRRVNKPA